MSIRLGLTCLWHQLLRFLLAGPRSRALRLHSFLQDLCIFGLAAFDLWLLKTRLELASIRLCESRTVALPAFLSPDWIGALGLWLDMNRFASFCLGLVPPRFAPLLAKPHPNRSPHVGLWHHLLGIDPLSFGSCLFGIHDFCERTCVFGALTTCLWSKLIGTFLATH